MDTLLIERTGQKPTEAKGGEDKCKKKKHCDLGEISLLRMTKSSNNVREPRKEKSEERDKVVKTIQEKIQSRRLK